MRDIEKRKYFISLVICRPLQIRNSKRDKHSIKEEREKDIRLSRKGGKRTLKEAENRRIEETLSSTLIYRLKKSNGCA